MQEMMMQNQIQDDSAPSRQRSNATTDKMNSAIGRTGSSEAGGDKLEKAKLAKTA
jgi:hypothetical protein